jgi:Nucleotidyltransferase domain
MSAALAELHRRARTDGNIRGLVVSGSVARGVATDYSDIDVYVVLDRAGPGWTTTRTPEIDTIVVTLAELEYLVPDPREWWHRWAFAYSDVALDRGGVAAAVDAQATLTHDEMLACLDCYLDGYINFTYRSLKAEREHAAWEQHLDAVEGVPWLLWCVFALACRVRPYNKYLRWELNRYPFTDPLLAETPWLGIVDALIGRGDAGAQRQAFAAVERASRHVGRGEIIDAWGDDLRLLRG